MMQRVRVGALLWVVAAALCCRTIPLPASFPTLSVPAGLTARDVEVAILAGIRNKNAALGYDPLRPPADFDRFVWAAYMSDPPGNSWHPESLQPGVSTAAITTPGH